MRPSGVGLPDPVRRDVDDVAEPPLALGEGGVALDRAGGVGQQSRPQQRAVAQPPRRGLGAQPPARAAEGPHRHLGVPVVQPLGRLPEALGQPVDLDFRHQRRQRVLPAAGEGLGAEAGQLADALADIGAGDPAAGVLAQFEDGAGDGLGQRRQGRFRGVLAGDVLVERHHAAIGGADVLVAENLVLAGQELAGHRPGGALAQPLVDRRQHRRLVAVQPARPVVELAVVRPVVERPVRRELLAEARVAEDQPVAGIPHRHADLGAVEREHQLRPYLGGPGRPVAGRRVAGRRGGDG